MWSFTNHAASEEGRSSEIHSKFKVGTFKTMRISGSYLATSFELKIHKISGKCLFSVKFQENLQHRFFQNLDERFLQSVRKIFQNARGYFLVTILPHNLLHRCPAHPNPVWSSCTQCTSASSPADSLPSYLLLTMRSLIEALATTYFPIYSSKRASKTAYRPNTENRLRFVPSPLSLAYAFPPSPNVAPIANLMSHNPSSHQGCPRSPSTSPPRASIQASPITSASAYRTINRKWSVRASDDETFSAKSNLVPSRTWTWTTLSRTRRR